VADFRITTRIGHFRDRGGVARLVHRPAPTASSPNTRTGERKMANKIVVDDCTSCGACEPECPSQAISSGDEAFVIDAAKCDECASNGGEPACMAVCPTDCIVKV
jgi:ferredoxin